MSFIRSETFRNIVIVLVGAGLIAFSAFNIVEQTRQEMSPFDQVDAPAEPVGDVPLNTPTSEPDPTEQVQEILAEDNAIVSGISSGVGAESPTVDPGVEQGMGYVPDRIVIEKISVDAPVIPVSVKEIKYDGKVYEQWLAPNSPDVGWHDTSAPLGLIGNTVLNGHHNVYGEVFARLVTLREGDIIKLYSGDKEFTYRVALTLLLPEKYRSLEDRMENARWILPTQDERITLITCWPKASNTHRVVVVALPVESGH